MTSSIADGLPGLRRALCLMGRCNGLIDRDVTEAAYLKHQDAVLGADGVDTEDLRRLSTWLESLSDADLEALVDGECSEMEAVAILGPRTADGRQLANILVDVFSNGAS